jgi:hypothetical protein
MGSGESKSAPASTVEGNKSAHTSTLEGNKSAPAGKKVRTFKLDPKSSIDANTLSGVADVLDLDIDIEVIAPNASFGMPPRSSSIGRSKVGQSPGRSISTRATFVAPSGPPPSGAIQRGRTAQRSDPNTQRAGSHARVAESTTAAGQQNNVGSNEQTTTSDIDNEVFVRLTRYLARKFYIDLSPTTALVISLSAHILGVWLIARWLEASQLTRPAASIVSDMFIEKESMRKNLDKASDVITPIATSLSTVYWRNKAHQAKMTQDHWKCVICLVACIGVMIIVSFLSSKSTVAGNGGIEQKSSDNLDLVVTKLSKYTDSAAFVLSILCDSASALSSKYFDQEIKDVCKTLELTEKIAEKIITAFDETGKALWKMLSSTKIKRILNELLTKDAFIAFKNFRIGSMTKEIFEITKGDDGSLMGVLKLVSYVNKNKPNLWISRVAGYEYTSETPSGLAYNILSNVVKTRTKGFTDQEIKEILAGTYNQKADDPTELTTIIKYLKSDDYTYDIRNNKLTDKLKGDIAKAKLLITN